jgi:hypothetical protein
MSSSKSNIQFNYLYRDAGNYKVSGRVIFSNPEGLSLEGIEREIRAALIDQEFFDPAAWALPKLGFDEENPELDHGWNEFESVEQTEEEPTLEHTVSHFLEKITNVPRYVHVVGKA